MNTTDKEKTEMNTTPTTNQRLVTILLVLLIVLVVLLIIGIIVGFLMRSGMMGGWMMGWGGITLALDAHLPRAQVSWSAGVTNNMTRACIDTMQNFQGL